MTETTQNKNFSLRSLYKKSGIKGVHIMLIVYTIFVCIYKPAFLGITNWLNILRQISVYGIICCGIAFVMIAGQADLSIGMMMTFLAATSVAFVVKGVENQFLAIIVPPVLGALFGLVNGLLVGKLKLNSFITTMGMMSVFTGLVTLFIKYSGKAIGSLIVASHMNVYNFLGQGSIAGIPVPALLMVIIALICSFVLKRTTFGAHVYMVGSNPVSARFSGIDSDRITVLTFVISGLTAGIGAVVMASRISAIQPLMANGYEFTALTALAIGGVSILGGRGSVWDGIFGVAFLGIVDASFTIMGINAYSQYLVRGALLVAAVAAELIQQRRRKAL